MHPRICFLLQTLGSQVLVKVVKNKLAPPFKTAQFELEFGKGICQEAELIDLGVKHKFISRAGGYYDLDGETYRGKDVLKKFLAENESAKEELLGKLREKLLYAGTEEEPETDAVTPDPTDEIVSSDSTDEETVTAVEA